MHRTITIALSIYCLVGCGLVPPVEMHGDPNLPDDEVAIVRTLGIDWFIYNGIESTSITYVDGRPVGEINMYTSSVEVEPGLHVFEIRVRSGGIIDTNYNFGVSCKVEFLAEAGREYVITAEAYVFYNGGRYRGAYIWVTREDSSEVIAGVMPTFPIETHSPEDLCTRA